MTSVMCKINLRLGEKILRGVIMIPCAVFLRDYSRSDKSIALFRSGMGRDDDIGDEL